jgi:hypothetical protein
MKKVMIFINSLLIVILLSKFTACNYAPGSYPHAEKYELNYTEEEVKTAIKKIKQEYPEYIVPKVTIDGKSNWDLIDEQSKEPSYWYIVYFYYPKENQIILAWTRPNEKGKTTFAFVSVNDGLTLGNWKEINKDFGSLENKEEKKKFEERILKKIKEKL